VIELLLKLLPARNVRVPRADLRWREGDPFDADAWRELATGELFFVAVGASARRRRPAQHLSAFSAKRLMVQLRPTSKRRAA
jgi:hypothetical protein